MAFNFFPFSFGGEEWGEHNKINWIGSEQLVLFLFILCQRV
jgi:hypothetical protein